MHELLTGEVAEGSTLSAVTGKFSRGRGESVRYVTDKSSCVRYVTGESSCVRYVITHSGSGLGNRVGVLALPGFESRKASWRYCKIYVLEKDTFQHQFNVADG